MKTLYRLLIVFSFAGIQLISYSQTFTNSGVLLTGTANGTLDWGDFDKDGDLDLLVTGDTASMIPSTRLYRNDGNNQFTLASAPFLPVYNSDADWGDYDNDGFLDVVICGDTMKNGIFQSVYLTKLYHNNGNGTFTMMDPGIVIVGKGSIAWADYDNDGDLDILCMSNMITSGDAMIRFFRNDGNDIFTDTGYSLEGNNNGVMKCGDMNNDGRVDIVCTGSTGWTKVYFNNGNCTFTSFTTMIQPYYFSDLDLADFDNDGDLDFVVAGLSVYNLVENTNIYRNNGNGTFSEVFAGLAGVKSSGVAWGDYNNDGNADLIVSGKLNNGDNYTKIYRNDGSDVFTEMNFGLSAVAQSSAVWADYDQDQDLDLTVTGRANLPGFQNTGILYQSNGFTANTVPSVPANLQPDTLGGNVTLSWNPSSDAQTPSAGLSYNIRIGTTPGGIDIMSPMSRIADGKRMIQKLGNVFQNTDWTIKNLPNGTYYWSVQAIDGAFAGSPFAAEQSFTIGPVSTVSVNTLPAFNVSVSTATLNGTVLTVDHPATAGFKLLVGSSWADIPATPSSLPANTFTSIASDLDSLTSGTTYSYFAWASVTEGANPPVYFYGDTLSFITTEFSVPISGDTATDITFYGAKLNGIVNPSGFPTEVSFELGTDTTYGYTIIAMPDSIEGSSPVAFETEIKGIAAGTTYHFRVKTVNSLGTIYGDDKTFTTLAVPTDNFTFSTGRVTNQILTWNDLGTSGTAISFDNYDDAHSLPVNIGFDFQYSGVTFDQLVINTNGFIKLGNIHPADSVQFFDSPRGTTTGPVGTMNGIFKSQHFADVYLISPFNHDLQAGTNTPEIRVLTEGVPGNRVCTIQFKNFQDKIQPPDRQYNNMQFQIKLHENSVVEFVYGSWEPSSNASAWRAASVGIKGATAETNQILSVTKSSNASWQIITTRIGNYCNTCNAFNFGNPTRPQPEAGRTYSFYPKVSHDATVSEIYTMGKLPIPNGLPHTMKAYIKNNGYDTLTNIPVLLTISGQNLFSASDTIPFLKPDSGFTVEFTGFIPTVLGYNTVNITLPADDYLLDNTKNYTQEITLNKMSYADTNAIVSAWAFLGNQGTVTALWLCKYHVTGVKNIQAARIGLGVGTGQNVYAVVLNLSGQIIAQSANYPLTAANSWKYHTFEFSNPPVISDNDFYIGLAETASTENYFPMGFQIENPNRFGVYYHSNINGTGITESVNGNSRFCIEALMEAGPCRPTFQQACNPSVYQHIDNVSTTVGITNILNLNTACSGSPNNYNFYPDQIVTAEKGTFFKFNAEGYFQNANLEIWADWNGDGDFYDTLELAYIATGLSTNIVSGKINIPMFAVQGNTALRFVIHNTEYSPPNPCGSHYCGETEDYSLVILPATLMNYVSGTTFQCDTLAQISRGTTNAGIIGIKMQTTGALEPLALTSFTISPAGSTDFTRDVSHVKVFFTGNDSVFSTSQFFGSSANFVNPIEGNATLLHGTNYFWVTYDITDTANVGDFLDASCLSYTVGSIPHVPELSSAPGKQLINYCIPLYGNTYGCEYGYGINSFSTTGGTTNITNQNNGCTTNAVSYSAFTNQSITTGQGSVFRFNFESTGDYNDFYIYIDWNQDFDFDEPNESVYFNDGGNYSLSGTITVPSDAAIGSTRFRIISAYHYYLEPKKSLSPGAGCQYFEYYGETEDYTINVVPGSPMIYLSGTTIQCDTTEPVNLGNLNVPVIAIKISVSGGMNPFSLTSFSLSSSGTTNFSHDVTLAQVYFTGNDSVFSPSQHGQLFGSNTDLGVPVTGNINLYPGNNYFWLTYNVADSATTNNYLDATCLGYTLAGLGDIAPEVISPPGRQIINYCIPQFDYPGGCDYGYGISSFSTSGGNTNISNLNNGCPDNAYDYSLFRDQVVSVKQGEAFQFDFESSGDNADFWMYIDWNQDFDFGEPNEAMYYNNAGNFSLSGIITVPSDAVIGSTRFRIISALHEEPWFKTSSPTGAGCQYVNNGGETEDYTINIIPAPPTKTLNLTAFLEGLYPETGGSAMSKARNASDEQFPGTTADIITVELRDAVSPFMLSGGPYTANLNIDGTASLSIPAAFSANYYIVVKHRNSIQTWSANPVYFSGSTINYNFSTSATAAYGNNLKQKGPLFLIYGGDVNQDGAVNALDQTSIQTAAVGFTIGYLTTDVNGDGIVDAFDLVMTDNNAAGFVILKKP